MLLIPGTGNFSGNGERACFYSYASFIILLLHELLGRTRVTISPSRSKWQPRGTGNGERGTGNGKPGTGVWERVYSGNPLESSKWRSKQKKRLEEKQFGLR